VGVRYTDDSGLAVRNISFTAKQGEMTVIVGNTGCGKTTLMQLIPRLYDVTEGAVRIGGVDVRELKLADLRSLIGYVPQRAFLYNGSIRSNIAFRDQMISDEEVDRAAELSQSMQFIKEKDKGFAEWIASGGSNVSGGQRQRLTIARALSGSPKILILDDSASALDLETGLKLRDAIRSIMGEITVIFVTQRLSFIRNADRIVVMQDGEVRAVGTHETLKANCDIYRDILESQMGA
jgi:ATP-binding cassette subfamily B protein